MPRNQAADAAAPIPAAVAARRALFFSHEHSLTPGGGGQQQCSREYYDTLTAAGFDLSIKTFPTDRTWRTKISRRLRFAPYSGLIPRTFIDRLPEVLSAAEPEFVFCNLHDLLPAGPLIRRNLTRNAKLVLLSHGLASVDEVHAARISKTLDLQVHPRKPSPEFLGAMLQVESETLPAFDHVFCLAQFEVEICRWLGARSASWLPRTIPAGQLLAWKPAGNRIGCVGTFDHPPNYEGLELFCAALNEHGPGPLRLRVATRSRRVVEHLKRRYAFIDDLGALDRPGELEAEATTWNAFLHPIFCYAMGCSTKVATGVSWGLPVITSTPGVRGYVWRHGGVQLADGPEKMASVALELLDWSRATIARADVLEALQSAPTLREVANQIRADLGLS